MDELKILVISRMVDEFPIDTGNAFIQTLIKNNALYLNYMELYNNYGFYGTHNYIKEYLKTNGINAIILSTSPAEFYFDINYFERIRKDIFLVMMTCDSEIYYDVSDQYYAQAMDLVITANPITTFKVRQIGVNSIIYWGYFNTSKYRKIENSPKDIDISFVGTLGKIIGRVDYIKYLLANGIHVETFGMDSPNRQITFEKKMDIINKSKINLDFSGASYDSKLTKKHQINKRKKQIKGKCFEAAICGSFALCEYAPGLEYFFEVGKEIDVFHDKEELLEKVKYYLEHEEERENIARRGYERAVKDYAVEQAVPKLISIIDELRKKKIYKPSEIYLDEEFIRNYTTYRVLLIIRFIKQLKWKFALEELKLILKYRKLDWYQICVFFIEEILGKFPKIKSLLKLIVKSRKNITL